MGDDIEIIGAAIRNSLGGKTLTFGDDTNKAKSEKELQKPEKDVRTDTQEIKEEVDRMISCLDSRYKNYEIVSDSFSRKVCTGSIGSKQFSRYLNKEVKNIINTTTGQEFAYEQIKSHENNGMKKYEKLIAHLANSSSLDDSGNLVKFLDKYPNPLEFEKDRAFENYLRDNGLSTLDILENKKGNSYKNFMRLVYGKQYDVYQEIEKLRAESKKIYEKPNMTIQQDIIAKLNLGNQFPDRNSFLEKLVSCNIFGEKEIETFISNQRRNYDDLITPKEGEKQIFDFLKAKEKDPKFKNIVNFVTNDINKDLEISDIEKFLKKYDNQPKCLREILEQDIDRDAASVGFLRLAYGDQHKYWEQIELLYIEANKKFVKPEKKIQKNLLKIFNNGQEVCEEDRPGVLEKLAEEFQKNHLENELLSIDIPTYNEDHFSYLFEHPVRGKVFKALLSKDENADLGEEDWKKLVNTYPTPISLRPGIHNILKEIKQKSSLMEYEEIENAFSSQRRKILYAIYGGRQRYSEQIKLLTNESRCLRSREEAFFLDSEDDNRYFKQKAEDLNRPMISFWDDNAKIDGGVFLSPPGSGGEEIVIDTAKQPEILSLYKEVKEQLKKKYPETYPKEIDILKEVYQMSDIIFPDSDVEELLESYQTRPGQKIALGGFIKEGVGVCRHKALTSAILLELFKKQNLLRGKISVCVNWLKNDGHAWCRYTTQSGTVYILDSAQQFFGKKDDAVRPWNYDYEKNR